MSIHNKNMKIFSQFILTVWLCALFSHGSHGLNALVLERDVSGDNETFLHLGADVDCHLCYNTLDRVEDVDLVGAFADFSQYALLTFSKPAVNVAQYYRLPQLRAPPFLT